MAGANLSAFVVRFELRFRARLSMLTEEMVPGPIFRLLLPLACFWAGRQERAIQREGVALTETLLADARRIGVAHPERVRLCAVETIPLRLNPVLRKAARRMGLVSPDTIGLTLRHGILIRSDQWGERRLVVHELAHTAQYERLGGFRQFLRQYLRECLTPPGYPFGALEQEAKRIEREICG